MNHKSPAHKSGKRELRLNVPRQRFEVRKNADGSTIGGYAAVFNSISEDLGGFKEKIQPGAFKQSLTDNPDVLAYYQHDSSLLLGRVSSGTLTIAEDSKGLKFTLKVPDTSTGRDLIVLAERGDLSGMSFGFSVDGPDGDTWEEISGVLVRTLIRVLLWEISIVTTGAYSAPQFSLRSLPAQYKGRIKRSTKRDADDDDDDDCDCDCTACESGDCDECTGDDDGACDEENCRNCPIQAETDTLRLRLKLSEHRAKKL